MRKFTSEDLETEETIRKLKAFDKNELIDYILENVNTECIAEFIKDVEIE
jgi:hypothetical protein